MIADAGVNIVLAACVLGAGYLAFIKLTAKGGKKSGGLGNLVGMHTLLTSNNVVTINPLPDIPGLIRIAEKAKGGIECVVSRVMPHCL